MSDILKADLDAIRGLADKQRGQASDLRGIDVAPALEPTQSLVGSDTAAACSQIAGKVKAALAEVAGRVDALAETNRSAANTIGETDESYANDLAKLNLAN